MTMTTKSKLSSKAALVFLVIDSILLVFNFYFHCLIKRMVRRKDKKKGQVIIKNLLACYSVIVPITFLIVFIYINILLNYQHQPSKIIGDWFCFSYEYFAHSTGLYLGAFSLFTAGMRYWFIVKNAKAKAFGEKKARGVFFGMHLALPIIMAALNSISNGNRDHIYVVNLCWAEHSETSMNVSTSAADVVHDDAASFLCSNRRYEIAEYLGENSSYYLEPMLRIICGSISVFYILFCSNMGEFLLYALIFRYLNK